MLVRNSAQVIAEEVCIFRFTGKITNETTLLV